MAYTPGLTKEQLDELTNTRAFDTQATMAAIIFARTLNENDVPTSNYGSAAALEQNQQIKEKVLFATAAAKLLFTYTNAD